MNVTSAALPSDSDEFAVAGLTPVRGRMTDMPLVAESLVSMECRLLDILRLKDLSGAQIESRLVIGQIVGIYIARDVIVDGLVDMFRARPICRAGGTGDYFEPTAEGYFHMPRPDISLLA